MSLSLWVITYCHKVYAEKYKCQDFMTQQLHSVTFRCKPFTHLPSPYFHLCHHYLIGMHQMVQIFSKELGDEIPIY